MPRYILRARTGSREQLEHSLKAHPDMQIVEEAAPRMVLVEGPAEAVGELGKHLPGWLAVPEVRVRPPVTRKLPK